MIQVHRRRAFAKCPLLVASVFFATSLPPTMWGQVVTDGSAKILLEPDSPNDGLEKLTNLIVGITEKRQRRSGEFPPIESEIQDLVDLERRYQGERIGCLAITHLCFIGSSYAGTKRPIHGAIDEVLEHLHKYGHLRDIAIGFDRLVENDGMNTLPALSRLIDSNETSPFVRESARLCRARWQLEMIEKRRHWASHLQSINKPSEIITKLKNT